MSFRFRAAALGIFLGLFGFIGSASAAPVTLYDNFPAPLPGNLPSLGYQATSTDQFGNAIGIAGGLYYDLSATLLMSNWAVESTYQPVGTSAGYNHPLTLNIYSVGAGGSVGGLLATSTINAFIPWRPEANPSCPGTAYRAIDGNCYNGSLSEQTFNFGVLNLPSQIIYGLSFNTTSHGDNPTGVPGPYQSLNYALAGTVALVGSNLYPNTAYWDTSHAPFYSDLGVGGVDTFRQDSGWDPYTASMRLTADDAAPVPEPATISLFGVGLAIVASRLRRRAKQ